MVAKPVGIGLLSRVDSFQIIMNQAIAALLVTFPFLTATPHCTGQYGVCRHLNFVPAAPGHTPGCARPGSTFCEAIDHYPKQTIRHLIERWGYDYNTLLSDETRDDFAERTYPHQLLYQPPPNIIQQPALSYGPFISNDTVKGYPDRRYPLDEQFLDNALQHPPPIKQGGFSYSTTVVEPFHRWIRSLPRTKRQAPNPNSGGLCPVTSTYVMPRAALNTRGNWMYTVNLNEIDDRYTQLVRSETCASRSCNGLCSIPTGYTARCEQQYVQKRLIALEGTGERLYTDTFWFPHCCLCQVVPSG